MKLLFGSILLSAYICIVCGWTALELTDNTVEHPGHCYGKAENVGAMEKGETKTLKGECVEAFCGDDTTISYSGCGSIGVPPKCKLSEPDLSKPYSDCCPKLICS